MKNAKTVWLMRLAVVAVAIFGTAFAVLWFMLYFGYSTWLFADVVNAKATAIEMGLFPLCCVPIYAVLGLGWSVSNSAARGEEFSPEVAKKFSLAGKILLWDSLVFIVIAAVFGLISQNPLSVFNVALGVVGLVCAFLSHVIGHYVKRAASYKEDSEAVI